VPSLIFVISEDSSPDFSSKRISAAVALAVSALIAPCNVASSLVVKNHLLACGGSAPL